MSRNRRPLSEAKLAAIDTMHRAQWGDTAPVGKTDRIRCSLSTAARVRAYAAARRLPVSAALDELLSKSLPEPSNPDSLMTRF